MTQEMSQADLEAGVLADLQAMRGEEAAEGNNSEAEEETVSEPEQEPEETPEDSGNEGESQADETEPEQEQTSGKKSKSNVPKILKERNLYRSEAEYWKAKAKELEEARGGYDDSDTEYVQATAKKIASEMIADSRFYDENPDAIEHKARIEEYKQNHNLDTETAFKLFLLEEMPEELAVMNRKKEAKKSAPPAVSSSKLRAEPKPADLSTKQLAQQLNDMIKKGELEI